jgi:hypothetical protein
MRENSYLMCSQDNGFVILIVNIMFANTMYPLQRLVSNEGDRGRSECCWLEEMVGHEEHVWAICLVVVEVADSSKTCEIPF